MTNPRVTIIATKDEDDLRFIAFALLEACQDALPIIDYMAFEGEFVNDPAVMKIEAKLKRAIAKATGKE